jgi:predicted DsbA family dithiol-disulfide isomerase
MDDSEANRPDLLVYADYVCPFCRLGHATLDEYLADRRDRGLPTLDVEWRPFDLRADERGPDGEVPADPERDTEKAGYVRSRWSEVETFAGRYGVEMTMDVESYLQVDARNAQLVALDIRRDDPDRFGPFHSAVFEALRTETRDVGDPAVCRDLTSSVDADPERVEEWISDESLREEFASATEAARRRGGRSVPTVVSDGQAVYGSKPPAGYCEVVEGTGEPTAENA